MRVGATFTLDQTFSQAFEALPRGLGVLGRYVLLELIGQGGMGVVWKAYDPVLDRQIALKLLVASSGAPGSVVSEAQAMARLQHPNVVAVYDAGVHEAGGHQLTYIAMELVVGKTLRQWLDETGRSLEDKLDMFVHAGRGLEAAHRAGLVHRDFKPANVLLGDDGRVRVSDFGLSVVDTPDPTPDHRVPTPVPMAGTPRYMSPGQLHGLPPDVRSDQFAYCVALYQAVFDEPPFAISDTHTVAELREAVMRPPRPPVRSRLAARVAPIVLRGLSAEPEDRWSSMTEVLAALDAVRRPGRRRIVVAGIVGAALIATGVLVWRQGAAADRICGHATDELIARWRPERRTALASAFSALPGGADAWHRAETALDEWTSRWSTLRVEQCEADRNGERKSPTLTARRECLDRRLGELDGLLRSLAAPDPTIVTYASGAAHGLTPPEGCTSVAPPVEGRPAAPLGPGIADAYAHIDRASALSRLGKERPALDEANLGADAAGTINWPPLTADAETERGLALLRVSETAQSNDAFYKALWAAEAARDDGQRLEAIMGLFSASLEASDYPTAGRWHQTAKAIAAHLPADALRQARLEYNDMELALYEGRYNDCLAAGKDGLRLAEAVGPETPIVVTVLITLSQCERSVAGNEDAAVAHLQRALPLSEKIHGHDHQKTSMILSELGIHSRAAKRYADALGYYRESLAIRERLVGADNPDCAGLHNNIANVYRDEKRFAEARAELNRALEIWTKSYGPDSPAVAAGLHNLGKIAMLEGHPENAEPLFRRTLEITRAKRPAGHPEIGEDADMLARALLAEHKAEALPLLEEALSILEHDEDSTKAVIAEQRFWVARARVELGIKRDSALTLATTACAAIDDPDMADEAAECRDWLELHRP